MVVDGAVMYAPGDVRVEERPDPEIVDATDATCTQGPPRCVASCPS
jgi:hypothetical protein